MNRPRTPGRKDLPRWFRARRAGAGGYYIEHPITRECSSLGTDKDEALALYWQIVPEIEAQVRAHRNKTRAASVVRVLAAEPKGESLRKFLERWRTKVLPTLTKRGSNKALGDKTAGDYARMLRRQIEPLDATTVPLVEADAQVMRGILRPWLTTPHHYNYVRAVLTRAMQHAVDEGVLSVNPMRSIEPRAKPKRVTYVTDDHYAAITERITIEYARRACDLLYLLGTRPADGLGLTLDSLVKQDGRWCVAFAAAKTGESQELVSNQALHDEIEWWRAWRTQHAPLSNHLIVHSRTAGRKINSRPIKPEWLSRVWREASDLAGHPEYTLRDLRPKSITDESLLGNTDNKGGHTEAMRKHYTRVRLPTRARVTVELPKRKTSP